MKRILSLTGNKRVFIGLLIFLFISFIFTGVCTAFFGDWESIEGQSCDESDLEDEPICEQDPYDDTVYCYICEPCEYTDPWEWEGCWVYSHIAEPTYISDSKRTLDPNYEKPLINVKNYSTGSIIVTYDKNLIENQAKLLLDSDLPSWLTLTGLDNVIEYDDEKLGAIEVTYEITAGNAPNTYFEVKFKLIDDLPVNMIDYKVVRICVEKTLTAEISGPKTDSLVRADVPIFGNAFGEGFSHYTVKYGQGLNPADWIIITNSSVEQKNDNMNIKMADARVSIYGNLATWRVGLTAYQWGKWPVDLNGIYTIRLEVTDDNNNTIADEVVLQVGRVAVQVGSVIDSPDNKVILEIPSMDTKNEEFVLAIEKANVRHYKGIIDSSINFVCDIYEVRPPGLKFGKPAALKFEYSESMLDLDGDLIADIEEEDLAVYTWNTILKKWTALYGIVDSISNTVTLEIYNTMPDFCFYSVGEYTNAPPAPILNTTTSPVSSRNMIISGNALPSSRVDIYVNGIFNNSVLAARATGSFSYFITGLQTGLNTITAKSVDERDRESEESEPISVEVIIAPPSPISSIEFMNSDYSGEHTGSIGTGDKVYIEMIGTDSSPGTIDMPEAKIYSTITYSSGLDIQLTETGVNTGIYRRIVELNSETGISAINDSVIYKLAAGYHSEKVIVYSLDNTSIKDELVVGDDIAPLPPGLSSLTHPSVIQDTFEIDLGQWINKDDKYGAALIQDDERYKNGKYSLKLLNELEGGFFSGHVITNGFNAKEYQEISFDYKIDKKIKVNIVIEAKEELLAIQFTDDNHNGWEGIRIIGLLPIINDNKWHNVKFNIYDILNNYRPHIKSYYVKKLMFADVSSDGCGRIAPGGNEKGIFFNIDNFIISKTVNSGDVKINLKQTPDGSGISDYSYVLDNNKDTIPDTVGEGIINEVEYNGLSDGTYYFHARAKDGNNNWGNNISYQIKIDTTGPVASNPFPADSSLSGSEKITLKISDNSEDGIYPETIRFSVEGTEYTVADKELSYDQESEVLTFKPVYPNTIVFADKQQIECSLIDVSDRAGNSLEAEYKWDWEYSVTNDHYNPHPAPIILSPSDNEIKTNMVTIEWDCYDLSGIKNYSYILSQEIGTGPDDTGEGTGTTVSYTDLEDGIYYFNIKAQDNNNNWDGITHYLLYINVPAQGETYYVNNETGSDGNDGLTWATALETIQAGVDKCADNRDNKIYVMATEIPYTGDMDIVEIEKSGKDTNNLLEVISYSEEENKRAVLDSKNESTYGFDIMGKYVLVQGFEIHSAKSSGIRLNFSDSCILKDNICHDNRVSGIMLRNSSINNQIISNICFNNLGNGGIFLRGKSKNNILNGNICSRNGDSGIFIGSESEENVVINNQIFKQKHGIYLFGKCYHNTITLNNIYSNSGKGIYLNNHCDGNDVSQNICYDNKEDGINVSDECVYNSIISNDCYRNNKGISLLRLCEDNSILLNNIWDNISYGMDIRNRCIGNEISKNRIENNSGYGIYIEEYCNKNEIVKNVVANNESAGLILMGNCMENEIISNENIKNKLGFRIENYCKDNNVSYNIVEENLSHGLKIYNNSSGNKLENNKLIENGRNGIFIESYCSDNDVVNNEITGNETEGIWIKENCNNNNILSNICNKNSTGIWVEESSKNNNIVMNVIEDNTSSGIRIANKCDGNKIDQNKICNNTRSGLVIREYCSGSIVSGNIIENNRLNSIALQDHCNNNDIVMNICNKNNTGMLLSGYCEENDITLNKINDNGSYGINVINNCNENKIESNESSDNIAQGINIEEYSSDNIVLNNVVINNKSEGIRVVNNCDNNSIASNTCNKNKTGLILSLFCSNNHVLENIMNESKIYGLNIKSSSGNEIRNNKISNSGDDGINIKNYSSDNEIVNNVIEGNEFDGIEMANECNNNIIQKNQIYNNQKIGFRFDNCDDNSIKENISYNNKIGMYMNKSDDNLLLENEFYANIAGIRLIKTKGINIYKNIIYLNQADGLHLDNADDTSIKNSTFYNNENGINITKLSDNVKIDNIITSKNISYGIIRDGVKIDVYYSDINDNFQKITLNTGSITDDPLFRDENNSDFHLSYNSPAIESGENGASMGRYTISVKQQDFRSLSDYVVMFKTSPIDGSIPDDGQIRIEMPVDFDLSKVSGVESDTMDGDFVLSFDGNTIIIGRLNGSATMSGDVEYIRIKDLEIHEAGTDFTLKLETRDSSGNVIDNPELSNDFEVKFDNTPPVTTLSMNDGTQYTNNNDIYATIDTKFVLTAEDILTENDSFASGLDYIEYSIDTSAWVTYSVAITLTEGRHRIYYRSHDKLGNIEDTKMFLIHIDDTFPHTDIAIGEPKYTDINIYITSDTPISLSAFDPEVNNSASGVKLIEYKINNLWQPYSGAFVVGGEDGGYEIYYRSRDNLEQIEASKLQKIVLDNTAPDIPVNLIGYIYNSVNISLYWDAVTNSDLAGYNIYDNGTKLNTEPITEITYQLMGVSSGTHSFTVSSIDLLGNESEQSEAYELIVDNSIIITRPIEGEYFRKMLKVIAEINVNTKKSKLILEYGGGVNPAEWILIKEFKNWPQNKDQLIHPWKLWIEETGNEIPLNGEYRLRIRIINSDGERENTRLVLVDNEVPKTTIKDTVNEIGEKIYISTDLIFEAIDPEINGVSSGIKYTKYRLASVGEVSDVWVEWDGNAIVLEEGQYHIWYYSADNAKMWMNDNKDFSGNVEKTNYNILVVTNTATESSESPVASGQGPGQEEDDKEADNIAPVIKITGVEEDKHYNEDVRIDVSIEDENLKSSKIILDNAPFESGSKVIVEKDHNLTANAEDYTGNKANESVDFTIDKTAPIINFTIVNGETYYNEVVPDLIVTEENINILDVVLKYRSNEFDNWNEILDWKPGTKLTEANDYILEVTCMDKAGNKTGKEISFSLETFKPEEVLIFRAEYNESADADHAEGSTKNQSGAKITTDGKGKEGEALPSYFTGNSGYARYKAGDNIDIKQGTVMMWVKPFWKNAEYQGSDQGRHLFTLYNNDNDFTIRFAVFKGAGTTVYIKAEDIKGDKFIIPFSVNTNEVESERWYKDGIEKWTHLSLSWDSGGCIKVHIDGELKGIKSISKWKPVNINRNSWIKIGDSNKDNPEGDEYTEFHGYIDKLKIYKLSLTDNQIKNIFIQEK